jgi:hypothetical protein
MGAFKQATDDFKNTIEREVQVEELKQLASTTIMPVHESISRSAPVTPEPAVVPAEAPKEMADLTPESVTKHDS